MLETKEMIVENSTIECECVGRIPPAADWESARRTPPEGWSPPEDELIPQKMKSEENWLVQSRVRKDPMRDWYYSARFLLVEFDRSREYWRASRWTAERSNTCIVAHVRNEWSMIERRWRTASVSRTDDDRSVSRAGTRAFPSESHRLRVEDVPSRTKRFDG